MTDNQSPTPPVRVEEVKPWPLNGYAPGNYSCRCGCCQCQFDGDKRAITCLECAVIASKKCNLSSRQSGIDAGLARGAEIARATKAYDDDLQKGSGCATTGERIASRILAARTERGEDNPNGR